MDNDHVRAPPLTKSLPTSSTAEAAEWLKARKDVDGSYTDEEVELYYTDIIKIITFLNIFLA